MSDATISAVIEQGGFAFAAVLFATVIVWLLRERRKSEDAEAARYNQFMLGREQFIDRMLVRLENTEMEHQRMVNALDEIIREGRSEHQELLVSMKHHEQITASLATGVAQVQALVIQDISGGMKNKESRE